MKKSIRYFYGVLFFLVTMFSLTGCQFLGDIFKAGMWVGILIVVVVIAIIIWVVAKLSGDK